MGTRRDKIMVGLSGGVDSAVAALHLLESGHEVEALHMSNWDDDDGYCAAAEDFQAARKVSQELDITLHRVDFSREYRTQVFNHFLHEYRAGRTPNPDVLCNREIKFGCFLAHALRLGARRIATGHYASLRHETSSTQLIKAADSKKDQTYFLHEVASRELSQAVFPLGQISKAAVRQRAAQAGLSNHDRRDSTGICFIGERPFREFLKRYIQAEPGPILSPEGLRLGTHDGLCYYTLGQRQGLGIGGRSGASGHPWYVAKKDAQRNVLVAVEGRDHPLLWSSGLRAGPPRWISSRPPAGIDEQAGFVCNVKTRYRQQDAACRAWLNPQGELELRFLEPQWAVTPGQSAVLYDGEICLGGAVIRSAFPAHPEMGLAASA